MLLAGCLKYLPVAIDVLGQDEVRRPMRRLRVQSAGIRSKFSYFNDGLQILSVSRAVKVLKVEQGGLVAF